MKEWTVMVYMAGDNNLSEDMVSELKGMQMAMKSHPSDQVNLVAIYDSAYFTVKTSLYRFTRGNADKRLKDCIVRVNPRRFGPNSEAPRLKDFVRYVLSQKSLEAKQYALIISGHSDGIMGRTMLRDSNPDSFVSLSKLRYILEVADNALPKGRRFDLLGFDSCLMSMLEVGYELRDIANVMVASQGLTPSSGWPFEQILKPLLSSDGKFNGETFASSIVGSFIDFNKEYTVGGRSVNINASNLSRAGDLKTAVEALGDHLNTVLNYPVTPGKDVTEEQALSSSVTRERVSELIHLSHYNAQTFMQEQAVDVVDFANSLKSRCAQVKNEIEVLAGERNISSAGILLWDAFETIGKLCDNIVETARAYVIANCFSGPEYQFSTGCSVFFPWTSLALNLVYHKYSRLDFSKERSPWLRFLETYTLRSQRPRKTVRFSPDLNFLQWVKTVNDASLFDMDTVNTVETTRAWDTRVWDARVWDARIWDARTDLTEFFKQFGRFRNFDMYHDPSDCN